MTRAGILQPDSLRVLCDHRDQAGAAARGRKPGEPFQGDPATELAEEIADAINYARQAQEGAPRRVRERYQTIISLQETAWAYLQAAIRAEGRE